MKEGKSRALFDLTLIVFLLYPSLVYGYLSGFINYYFLIFQSIVNILLFPTFLNIFLNVKEIRNRFIAVCSVLTALAAILYYWGAGYYWKNQEHYMIMYAFILLPTYPILILYFSRVASDENFNKYQQGKIEKI